MFSTPGLSNSCYGSFRRHAHAGTSSCTRGHVVMHTRARRHAHAGTSSCTRGHVVMHTRARRLYIPISSCAYTGRLLDTLATTCHGWPVVSSSFVILNSTYATYVGLCSLNFAMILIESVRCFGLSISAESTQRNSRCVDFLRKTEISPEYPTWRKNSEKTTYVIFLIVVANG